MIDGAKQPGALENKQGPDDTPTREDLLLYLPGKRFPVCPAGGTYTINRMADPPDCPGSPEPASERSTW
jgi:hypothetical protein